jgi:hypothetical protein
MVWLNNVIQKIDFLGLYPFNNKIDGYMYFASADGHIYNNKPILMVVIQ